MTRLTGFHTIYVESAQPRFFEPASGSQGRPIIFLEGWGGGEGMGGRDGGVGMKNVSLQTFFSFYAPLQIFFSNNTFFQIIFFRSFSTTF